MKPEKNQFRTLRTQKKALVRAEAREDLAEFLS